MTNLYYLIFQLCLISTVFAYALDGSWTLRTSEIAELKKIKGGILFTFEAKAGSNQEILHTLTIYACSKLSYTYTLQDDQIYFSYTLSGSQLRSCVQNQLVYLRGQLDVIFNFYIMGNVMLMLAPNNQSPIKLDRYVGVSLSQVNGIWSIVDAAFYSKVTEPGMTVNGSHIALCGGRTLFTYRLAKDNSIRIKKVSEISCNNLTVSKLDSASLYRVNSKNTPNRLYIYDSNASLIMQLAQQADYPIVKSIPVGSTSNPIQPSNPTSNAQNTSAPNATNQKANSSVAVNKEGVATVSKNTTAQPTNSSNNSTVTNNRPSINANSSKNTSSANNSSQTAAKTGNTSVSTSDVKAVNQTKQASPVQNKTANQSTSQNNTASSASSTNITNSTKNSSNPPTTNVDSLKNLTNNSSKVVTTNTSTKNNSNVVVSPQNLQNLIAIESASQAFGIWYPYNISQIAALSSYPANAFSRYQVIVNAARILISGGCNTIFSTYSFSQGRFNKFKKSSTQNKCNPNYDSVIADILYGENQFYVSASSSSIMGVKSADSTWLMLFSKTAPQ